MSCPHPMRFRSPARIACCMGMTMTFNQDEISKEMLNSFPYLIHATPTPQKPPFSSLPKVDNGTLIWRAQAFYAILSLT